MNTGFVYIDSTLPAGARKKTIESSLAQSFLTSSTPFQTAVNAYLVHMNMNMNMNLILADTGTMKQFGANLGFVLENLRAVG